MVEVSHDLVENMRLTLDDLPGMGAGGTYVATFEATALLGGDFVQSGDEFKVKIPHGGTIVISPVP